MLSNINNKSGFTIVELLIVIVVIAILAAITTTAYNGVSARANDARRTSDANAIVKALNIYNTTLGSYPLPTSANGSWEMSAEDTPQDFIESLKDQKIISTVPVDPVNTSASASYYYYRYGAGSYGCDAGRGAYFVFGVKDLQSSAGASSQSPGWACPTRNWQPEFDWVTGGFEN